MSDAHHASRGLKLTLSGQAAKFVLQLASTVVLARLLTPADFGLFAMVVALTGFAVLVADFGLSSAAVQASELSRQQKTNLFWINSVVGAVLFGTFWLLAEPIASFYSEPELTAIVRVLAFNFIVLGATAQFTANLTRELQFGRLIVADLSSQAIGFGSALTVALIGGGYWALVAQHLVSGAVLLLVSGAAVRWFPGLPRRAPMRNLLRFASHSLGVQALAYVSANIDSVVLGRVAGATQLGFYDRAYQLFKVPIQQIAGPLTRVALPILSRQQSDRALMSRYVVVAQAGIAYLLGAVFSLGAALATPVVLIVLGSQWLQSAGLFAILATGGLFQALGYVYYWAFLARGLSALQLRYSVLTRTLMIALIVVGAVMGGATGVAIAVSAGLALNWLILSIFPMRQSGLDTRSIVTVGLRAMALHICVSGIVACVDLLWMSELEAWIRLSIGLGLATALYVMAWYCFWPVRRDLKPVLRMVRMRR